MRLHRFSVEGHPNTDPVLVCSLPCSELHRRIGDMQHEPICAGLVLGLGLLHLLRLNLLNSKRFAV